MMIGGFNGVKEADGEIITLANSMKEKVEDKLGETFDVYEPILYSSQVVSGTNYNIKIHAGDERFIHIKINVPLPIDHNPPELLEYQKDKSIFDPLI